jgi:AraC family transcriptional regulator
VIKTEEKPTFSSSSLLCRHSLPSTIIATSCAAGWTSVLIDHHRVYPSEESFETLPTPDQTIVVMTRGEQTIESFNAGTWRQAIYRAGTIGMTPGGDTDRLRRRMPRKPAPFEKANLYIPQRFFHEAAEHYRQVGHRCRDNPLTALAFNDPLIAQTVFALLRAMAAGAPDLYAQTAMQWLAAHLLSAHSSWLDVQEDRRDPGVISDKRLARVLEYMSAHFAEPLTLENLAKEAAISKFHFTRLFRESTGATPHAFLIQLRMEAARRMLTTTDLNVAEIAASCGFARPAHFGTAFTKRFGVSPTAFRGQARG